MNRTVLVIGVMVVFSLACGGPPPPKQPAKVHAAGEKVTVGESLIVVHGAEDRSRVGNRFVNHKAPEGATLRIVDVSVTNDAKRPFAMAGRVVLVGDDTLYTPTGECMIALKDSFRMLEALNPGITRRGKVCFEVPAGVGTLRVGVKPGLFGAPVEFAL